MRQSLDQRWHEWNQQMGERRGGPSGAAAPRPEYPGEPPSSRLAGEEQARSAAAGASASSAAPA
eukprot:15456653-Alexandrium_andersonii.AAC.1